MTHPLLDIKSYIDDGFKKVAIVQHDPNKRGWWRFEIIDEDTLYEDHRSWVYVIVVGNEVYKLGETGNPLGIMSTRMPHKGQPIAGTVCRFGRLRSFGDIDNDRCGDTDGRIRRHLQEEVSKGLVSIWVKRCDVFHVTSKLYGQDFDVPVTYHKDIEKGYLTKILNEVGRLPHLNTGRI